jgi:hypothetical protein
MKLGLNNNAVIIPIEKNCIEFNNINFYNLQMRDIVKITELYTQWFSVCPNVNSKYHIIAMFKSFVKENDDSNKTCTCVNDLRKIEANVKFQPPTMFEFLVFGKS